MAYADGFVIPIPKKNVEAYRKIARKASKVWMEHGALEYYECVGDDLAIPLPFTGFPKLTNLKKNETVIFAWIVYKSKAHRDRVNAKVMKDPRLKMAPDSMPFDHTRMSMGGFKVIVKA
jgi:uncharacterized protein YbaA (DUF1428 family)